MLMIDKETKNKLITAQGNEITEHFIYAKLAQSVKDPDNKEILIKISRDELRHCLFWKKYTRADVKPDKLKVWKYFIISKILGITFGIKLMEKGEGGAQITYKEISKIIPGAKKIMNDEEVHEKQLIGLIDEERLKYVSSVVLGLNDALVEFTGALAGFSFALNNARLVGVTGLITGIAASLSMAASEYLSTKSEENTKKPLKAAVYTGITYFFTVLLLVLPFLLWDKVYGSLAITLAAAIFLIYIFTYYISVAKDLSFKTRFFEMAAISLGVAAVSFGIGVLVKIFFNI